MEPVVLFFGMLLGIMFLAIINKATGAAGAAAKRASGAVRSMSSADGVRAAMRHSYHKHHKRAVEGHIQVPDGTSLHHGALFGALASRYRVTSTYNDSMEPFLWLELAPFLEMTEQGSVDALAEYVVYRELPSESRTEWLGRLITNALMALGAKGMSMLRLGEQAGAPWVQLVSRQDLESNPDPDSAPERKTYQYSPSPQGRGAEPWIVAGPEDRYRLRADEREPSVICSRFGVTRDVFNVKYQSYSLTLKLSRATEDWNQDIDELLIRNQLVSADAIGLASEELHQALLNRVILAFFMESKARSQDTGTSGLT